MPPSVSTPTLARSAVRRSSGGPPHARGPMVARDLTFVSTVMGDAMVRVDFAGLDADVTLAGIVHLTARAQLAPVSWTDVPISTAGTFADDRQTLRGACYGPQSRGSGRNLHDERTDRRVRGHAPQMAVSHRRQAIGHRACPDQTAPRAGDGLGRIPAIFANSMARGRCSYATERVATDTGQRENRFPLVSGQSRLKLDGFCTPAPATKWATAANFATPVLERSDLKLQRDLVGLRCRQISLPATSPPAAFLPGSLDPPVEPLHHRRERQQGQQPADRRRQIGQEVSNHGLRSSGVDSMPAGSGSSSAAVRPPPATGPGPNVAAWDLNLVTVYRSGPRASEPRPLPIIARVLPLGGLLCVDVIGQPVADSLLVVHRNFENGGQVRGFCGALGVQLPQNPLDPVHRPEPPQDAESGTLGIHELVGESDADQCTR